MKTFIALLQVSLLVAVADVCPGEVVVHELTIEHPGKEKAVDCKLQEERGGDGQAIGYSMEVESVTCADKKCGVVPVRLFWDELGNYLRYELSVGDELTKKDHMTFTDEDYETLGKILAKPDSPLRWVGADELVPPEKAIREGVDVVSGATFLSQRGTVVKGAAYTCYTLWHWVYGGVRDEIRRLTGKTMDKGRVLAFLTGEDTASALFALEQLAGRKLSDREIIDEVVRRVRLGDDAVARKALRCLERQAPGDFFQAIEGQFLQAGRKKRVLFLRSLAATKHELPGGFLDRISGWIPQLGGYQEVDLMLKLTNSRGAPPAMAIKRVVELLGEENFLVARRAYWFLEEQELDAGSQKRMDAFRAQHGDRL